MPEPVVKAQWLVQVANSGYTKYLQAIHAILPLDNKPSLDGAAVGLLWADDPPSTTAHSMLHLSGSTVFEPLPGDISLRRAGLGVAWTTAFCQSSPIAPRILVVSTPLTRNFPIWPTEGAVANLVSDIVEFWVKFRIPNSDTVSRVSLMLSDDKDNVYIYQVDYTRSGVWTVGYLRKVFTEEDEDWSASNLRANIVIHPPYTSEEIDISTLIDIEWIMVRISDLPDD